MYTGYELTEKSRAEILTRFPPRYPDVIAHHITEQFGVPEGTEPPPQPDTVRVVGYVYEDMLQVEALLVEINGTTLRPNQPQYYHITLSINRDKGAKPVHSNNIMQYAELIEPFDIEVVSKVMQ